MRLIVKQSEALALKAFLDDSTNVEIHRNEIAKISCGAWRVDTSDQQEEYDQRVVHFPFSTTSSKVNQGAHLTRSNRLVSCIV